MVPALLKMLVCRDASAFYNWFGDDVVALANDHFRNPNKVLWLNLGYWREARTYPEACQALARMLGDAAALGPGDRVLDVGFGYAEQDLLWLAWYNVRQIVGVNVTPLHVEVATQRVREQNLHDRIEFYLGSATELRFEIGSFDKVMALECAFHFATREKFFAEAFRVLRPGGRYAAADILPAPGKSYSGLGQRLGRRLAAIPSANMYDRYVYADKLRAAGFVNVWVESIAHYVFPGMYKYSVQRRAHKDRASYPIIELQEREIETCAGVQAWESGYGFSDYILVTADKPIPE